LAASVTVKSNGSMTSIRMNCPGWEGLAIRLIAAS
jgi:hypothetical protein